MDNIKKPPLGLIPKEIHDWKRLVEIVNAIELPKKKVYQYSLNGDYIRSFDSMCQAAKSVGKDSISGIRNVCMREKGRAYGYKWRFYKSDSLKAI